MTNSGFKKFSFALALMASVSVSINGCATLLVGGAAAGAGAYIGSDSRTVDRQFEDQKLANSVLAILKNDNTRSNKNVFRVDCLTLNGNVLLVGQTRDTEYINWAISEIKKLKGVKRIFNCVANKDPISAKTIASDSYITSQVKSLLLFGSKISSGRFKVYTEDSVVYMLGYVTKNEAQRAINQARKVDGVTKIHPIFDYMDENGTPNSSDINVTTNVREQPVTTTSASSLGSTTAVRSSSSLASEVQGDVDNGGAVLEDDENLLAPSAPAQSF